MNVVFVVQSAPNHIQQQKQQKVESSLKLVSDSDCVRQRGPSGLPLGSGGGLWGQAVGFGVRRWEDGRLDKRCCRDRRCRESLESSQYR